MMGPEVEVTLGETVVRKLTAIAGVLLVLAMAGCTSGPVVREPLQTPSGTAIEEVAPTPTPTPKPSPAARQIGFECLVELPKENSWDPANLDYASFMSLQEAWAYTEGRISGCEIEIVKSGPISTTEKQAVATAGYDSESKVELLWQICARKDHFYATNGPLNDAQRTEANGALILCPDHPGAATMANGSPEQNERNSGLRFGDGVREVGARIQPGTYRSGPVENCYWARLDSAGEVIDNNFVLSATQVEVNVQPSDFSLHTEGCGEFVKVG
jgi:hypothetical protein